MKKLKIVGLVSVLLQLILSVVAVILVAKLNILPGFYLFMLVLVLILLFMISAIFVIGRSRFRVSIAAVFALLMCVFLSILSFKYVLPAIGTLDNITTEKQTYLATYYIIIKTDDPASKPDDIKEYRIGVEKSHDFEAMKKALEGIATQFNHTLNVIAYDDYSSMWSAFIDQSETGAILMETNYYNIYKDYYEEQGDNINNYVRLLGEIQVEMAVEKTEENTDSETENKKEITKDSFVLYISGIDVSGSINQRSRSDVNIIMAINPTKKKITLATVPRDAYVKFPGVTGDARDKLTHAAIFGKNDCSVSMKTLEQSVYTGIEIDYWVRVNFTSLEKIVDALGGIEAYSEYGFTSTFSGDDVWFNKGMNKMNGWKALIFCRERKTVPGGEPQRGKNQLEVIKGIFNKATSPSILVNYNDVLDEISDCILTDMPMEHITSLIKMQLDDGASWSFETVSVGVEYVYDYCYSMPGQKLCVGIIDEGTRVNAIAKIKETLGN